MPGLNVRSSCSMSGRIVMARLWSSYATTSSGGSSLSPSTCSQVRAHVALHLRLVLRSAKQ
jgi:hypothetical protein